MTERKGQTMVDITYTQNNKD